MRQTLTTTHVSTVCEPWKNPHSEKTTASYLDAARAKRDAWIYLAWLAGMASGFVLALAFAH
jgi:hypothetical protein